MELTIENFGCLIAPDTMARFSADLMVEPTPGVGLVHVCHWTGDRFVTVHQVSKASVLAGFVTFKALAHIERLRTGHTLNFLLRAARSGVQADGLPAPMDDDLRITVPAEIWSAELAEATASSFYDLAVPVTDDPAVARASDHLRAARDVLRDGLNDPKAAIRIRQALDIVCTAYNTTNVVEAARRLNARDRTVQQRWAMSVEDTCALLDAFIHNRQEVVEAGARRALACCLLAEVAARVECLAADRSAGLVRAVGAGPGGIVRPPGRTRRSWG